MNAVEPGSKPVIYLDQNHWIGLLRATRESARASGDYRLLQKLRDGVQAGSFVCALSGSHYHETWHRVDKDSRYALAGLMQDLTGYVTLAPHQTVRLQENRALLAQLIESGGRLSHEVPVTRSLVIGRGVDHAFSSPTGRFRFVAHLASEGLAEGDRVDPPDSFTAAVSELKAERPDLYEWISLAGFDEHPDVEGFELFTQRRRGREFADFRTDFSSEISRKRTHNAENVHRFLLVEFARRISEELRNIGKEVNAPVPVLESWKQIESIIEAMPSSNTLFRLLRSRQRNRQKRWEPNDLGDLSFLAVAVPYADLIVTERQWAATVRMEHLDQRYRTKVLHRRSDLLAELENDWPRR
jgi:hypothetical protein